MPVTWGGHSASRLSENRYFPTFFDRCDWECPRQVTPHVTTPPLVTPHVTPCVTNPPRVTPCCCTHPGSRPSSHKPAPRRTPRHAQAMCRRTKSPISPYIYGIGKGDGVPSAAVMTACWGPAGDTPGTASKRFEGSLDVVAARITSQPSEFQALRRSVPVEPCAVVRSAGRDDRRTRLDEFHIGVVE